MHLIKKIFYLLYMSLFAIHNAFMVHACHYLAIPGEQESTNAAAIAEQLTRQTPPAVSQSDDDGAEEQIAKLLQKQMRYYDEEDFKVLSEIASSILLAMSYEEKFKDDILSLITTDDMFYGKILYLSDDVLTKLVTILNQSKRDNDKNLFCKCLIIAYKCLKNKADNKSTLYQKMLIFQKRDTIIRNALILWPNSRKLLSDLAHNYNHLHKWSEAEKIFEMLSRGRKWVERFARANAGYTKLEMTRKMFRMLQNALMQGRFNEVMTLIDSALIKGHEGKTELWKIINAGKDDKTQVPRAYSGIAEINRVLSDMYHEVYQNKDFSKDADAYVIEALRYSVSSLSNSIEALRVVPDNADSLKIFKHCLENVKRELDILLRYNFKDTPAMETVCKIMQKLDQVFSNNKLTLPGNLTHRYNYVLRLEKKYMEEIQCFEMVKNLYPDGLLHLLNNNDFDTSDDFYKKLQQYMQEHTPVDKHQAVRRYVHILKRSYTMTVLDLVIIQICLTKGSENLKSDEIASEALNWKNKGLGKEIGGLSKNDLRMTIEDKFKKGIFDITSFSLKHELIENPPAVAQKKKEKKENSHRGIYNKDNVFRIRASEGGRIREAINKYEKLKPWLSAEEIEKFEINLMNLKNKFKDFENDVNKLKVKTKPGEADTIFESIHNTLHTTLVGKTTIVGYYEKIDNFESDIAVHIQKVVDMVEQQRLLVCELKKDINKYNQQFDFKWLMLTFNRCNNIIKDFENVKKVEHPVYLSKKSYEDLVSEYMSLYTMPDLIEKHKERFAGINRIIREIEGILEPVKCKLKLSMSTSVEDLMQEAKEEYENAALHVDFEKRADRIKDTFNAILKNIKRIVVIIEAEDEFVARYNIAAAGFLENNGIYLKKNKKFNSKEQQAVQLLTGIKEILEEFHSHNYTYDTLDSYEETLQNLKNRIHPKYEQMGEILKEIIQEKSKLILQEIEYFELFMQRIKLWFSGYIYPHYKGSSSYVTDIKKGIDIIEKCIEMMKQILIIPGHMERRDKLKELKTHIDKVEQFKKAIYKAFESEEDRFKKKLFTRFKTFMRTLDIRKDAQLLCEKQSLTRDAHLDITRVCNEFSVACMYKIKIVGDENKEMPHTTKEMLKIFDPDLQTYYKEVLDKWRTFEDNGEFPTPSFIYCIEEFIQFYYQLIKNNYRVPIIPALNILQCSLGVESKRMSELTHHMYIKELKEEFFIKRTGETLGKEWEIIKKLFKQVNPSAEEAVCSDTIVGPIKAYMQDENKDVHVLRFIEIPDRITYTEEQFELSFLKPEEEKQEHTTEKKVVRNNREIDESP